MKLSDKKNPALVLSGGGIKAVAFHAGVCLALRERGFKFAGGSPENVEKNYKENSMTFKTYVGSSSGSHVCASLAAGHSLDSIINVFVENPNMGKSSHELKNPLRAIKYKDIFSTNLNTSAYSRFIGGLFKKSPTSANSMESFFKTRLRMGAPFTVNGIENYFRRHVLGKNDFSKLGVDLYIVATELNHAKKIIFSREERIFKDESQEFVNYAPISEAIAASSSLPPFFAPYSITNKKGQKNYFFDGEIRDTLSANVAEDAGSDLVIASYSIQPYQFNKEIGSLHEYGISTIFSQALCQLVQQKIEAQINHKLEIKDLISAVSGYLTQIKLSEDQKEKILNILVSKTKHNPNVEYLYIHPSTSDYEMFFADHFSLNPKTLNKLIQVGFRSAMKILRKHV